MWHLPQHGFGPLEGEEQSEIPSVGGDASTGQRWPETPRHAPGLLQVWQQQFWLPHHAVDVVTVACWCMLRASEMDGRRQDQGPHPVLGDLWRWNLPGHAPAEDSAGRPARADAALAECVHGGDSRAVPRLRWAMTFGRNNP